MDDNKYKQGLRSEDQDNIASKEQLEEIQQVFEDLQKQVEAKFGVAPNKMPVTYANEDKLFRFYKDTAAWTSKTGQ